MAQVWQFLRQWPLGWASGALDPAAIDSAKVVECCKVVHLKAPKNGRHKEVGGRRNSCKSKFATGAALRPEKNGSPLLAAFDFHEL
jgi:hypothetical protein